MSEKRDDYGQCPWCKEGRMQFLAEDYGSYVYTKCNKCHHEGMEVVRYGEKRDEFDPTTIKHHLLKNKPTGSYSNPEVVKPAEIDSLSSLEGKPDAADELLATQCFRICSAEGVECICREGASLPLTSPTPTAEEIEKYANGYAQRMGRPGGAVFQTRKQLDAQAFCEGVKWLRERLRHVAPDLTVTVGDKSEPSAKELLKQGICPCGSDNSHGCSVSGCPLYLADQSAESFCSQRQKSVVLCSHGVGIDWEALCKRTEKERDELRWHWERVASHVFPGHQDTVETVIAMLKEREELKARVERLREQRNKWIERAATDLHEVPVLVELEDDSLEGPKPPKVGPESQ